MSPNIRLYCCVCERWSEDSRFCIYCAEKQAWTDLLFALAQDRHERMQRTYGCCEWPRMEGYD